MGLLRIDLHDDSPLRPDDLGSPRVHRIALRTRLLQDAELQGRDALALARDLQVVELSQVIHTLRKVQ